MVNSGKLGSDENITINETRNYDRILKNLKAVSNINFLPNNSLSYMALPLISDKHFSALNIFLEVKFYNKNSVYKDLSASLNSSIIETQMTSEM